MKAIVTKKFIDKHTKELNEKGKIIEISDERAAELKKAGNYIMEFDLDTMKKTELTELAKQNQIKGYTQMDVEELRTAVKAVYEENK